jgi:putative peptidoglycan lipid II flippase
VFLAVAAGCAAMAAVLVWQTGDLGQWAQAGAVSRAVRLAALIALGAAVYAAATLAGGLRVRHLGKGGS